MLSFAGDFSGQAEHVAAIGRGSSDRPYTEALAEQLEPTTSTFTFSPSGLADRDRLARSHAYNPPIGQAP